MQLRLAETNRRLHLGPRILLAQDHQRMTDPAQASGLERSHLDPSQNKRITPPRR